MKKVRVSLSTSGIERLQKELEDYKEWQKEKAKELALKLAKLGVEVAKVQFARGSYAGVKDAQVLEPIETGNGYIVRADGKSVLFIEFGSGITYGFGHPEAQEHRMGPSTYPSEKEHWRDPNGWWLPKEAGGGHTYGNQPAMAMYEARKTILRELPRIVKEVFG